jgi:hypothetical protein
LVRHAARRARCLFRGGAGRLAGVVRSEEIQMRVTMIVLSVAGLAVPSALAQDYYNQADFENATNGAHVQYGFEDLEDNNPGFGIVGFDDPLTRGVANGPFPNGLTAPITVQSNLSNGQPNTPNPHGIQGLAAVEFGSGFGETSDIVVANYFVDSFDIIMQDNFVTAVGFNTIDIFGGGSVEIGVYGLNNEHLGTFSQSADAGGSNFFGFIDAGGIGRINVWSTAGGAEGADNISIWSRIPAPGAASLLGLGGLVAGRRRRA